MDPIPKEILGGKTGWLTNPEGAVGVKRMTATPRSMPMSKRPAVKVLFTTPWRVSKADRRIFRILLYSFIHTESTRAGALILVSLQYCSFLATDFANTNIYVQITILQYMVTGEHGWKLEAAVVPVAMELNYTAESATIQHPLLGQMIVGVIWKKQRLVTPNNLVPHLS